MALVNLGRVVGDSAYEVAVKQGFVGTESEWLQSLIATDEQKEELYESIIEQVEGEIYTKDEIDLKLEQIEGAVDSLYTSDEIDLKISAIEGSLDAIYTKEEVDLKINSIEGTLEVLEGQISSATS